MSLVEDARRELEAAKPGVVFLARCDLVRRHDDFDGVGSILVGVVLVVLPTGPSPVRLALARHAMPTPIAKTAASSTKDQIRIYIPLISQNLACGFTNAALPPSVKKMVKIRTKNGMNLPSVIEITVFKCLTDSIISPQYEHNLNDRIKILTADNFNIAK